MSETVRELAERLAREALAERYSAKVTKNEAWNRLADREAFRRGEEYAVPEFRERTADEMADDTCTVMERNFDEEDGIFATSFRSLTYREVVSVVIERLAREGIIPNGVLLPTGFRCGEPHVERGTCLREIGTDGTCPDHPPGDDGLTDSVRDRLADDYDRRTRSIGRTFAAARRRLAALPPHARPVLTRPMLASRRQDATQGSGGEKSAEGGVPDHL